MNGILYIAYGQKYVRGAINSALSARRHVPQSVKTGIMTTQEHVDECSYEEVFDDVMVIETTMGKKLKVDFVGKSPYDNTLYLDADTEVVGDLGDVFTVLNWFDFAACHAHRRNHKSTHQEHEHVFPYGVPQWNGGVLLFNGKGKYVLSTWGAAYRAAGYRKDQVSLREIILGAMSKEQLRSLKAGTLPPEYNVRYQKTVEMWRRDEADIKILHFKDFVR